MSAAGGYLSGNMLVAYPLKDGQAIDWILEPDDPSSSSGLAASGYDPNSAMLALQSSFVDASIVVDSEVVTSWPSIGSISVCGHSMSFVISANGHEAIVDVDAGSDPFPIYSGRAEFGSYVITMSSDGIRGLSSFCEMHGVRPASRSFPPSRGSSSSSSGDGGNYFLELCAKCVSVKPAGLRSIKVYDGVRPMESGPHFVLAGDVSIVPGNNMELLDQEDVNGVEISAVPGAGMGIVACGCSGESVVDSPLKSPHGHVRVFNDTCYDIEPGGLGMTVIDGVPRMSRDLIMHSKCTACCTCDMYASIVNEKLVGLSNAIRSAKSEIDVLLDKYNRAVSSFNSRISKTKMSDMSLALSGMPVGSNLGPKMSGTKVKGKMLRCAFVAIVRNSSFESVTAKVISLTGTGLIVEATASWSKKDGTPQAVTSSNGSGIVNGKFTIYPGRSLVITFVRAVDSMVSEVKSQKYRGAVSVNIVGVGTLKKSIEV